MIRVVCGCGRVFKAEDRHSGKRTRCPVCGMSLIIGHTPASSSSEGDLDEVPSWWYPSDPQHRPGAERPPPGGSGDPDAVRTVILPPVSVPGIGATDEDPGRGPAVPAAGPPAEGSGIWRGRLLWAAAGGLVAAAAMALGALLLRPERIPGRDERVPARGAADPIDLGEDSSGARPRLTVPPRSSGRTDRGDGVADGSPARAARRLHLLVPAYFYPKGEGRRYWTRLIEAASKVDVLAIINPGNGPGLKPDPVYAAIFAEAARRGVQLVGYVSTDYTNRPLAAVKDDILTWLQSYPQIVGFFLDQQLADGSRADYYAEISAYARAKLPDALIITNPGVPCDEVYLARRSSDLICIFGNSDGFGSLELPTPLKDYDASRFAAMAYNIGDVEAMRAMFKDAIIKRIGYLYVTDGTLPNPWDHLPPYWEDELDAVAQLQ